MNMKLKVAVDCGRGHVKVASYTASRELVAFSFANRVEKDEVKRLGDSHLVEYKGVNYRLGENTTGISSDSMELDKLDDNFKLNIYTATALMISKLNQPSVSCSVDLKINVPLSLFKDEAERSRYQSFFDEKNVSIRVDGRMYVFYINSVEVFYEGSGFLLSNIDLLDERNEYFTLIDFGSLNLSYAEFDNELRPSINRCDSLMAGSHVIINHLYRVLQGKGYRYDNYEIQASIQGAKKLKPEATIMVDYEIENWLEKNVFTKLDAIDWNGKIYFTGGSSLLFKKYIEKKMAGRDYEISENAWFDNAVGFLNNDDEEE